MAGRERTVDRNDQKWRKWKDNLVSSARYSASLGSDHSYFHELFVTENGLVGS